MVTASVSATTNYGAVVASTTARFRFGAFSINQFGTLGYLDNTFTSLVDAVKINSQTFDADSDANVGGNMRFSNTQTTFDADEFSYYTRFRIIKRINSYNS